jgi:hypothetical protein
MRLHTGSKSTLLSKRKTDLLSVQAAAWFVLSWLPAATAAAAGSTSTAAAVTTAIAATVAFVGFLCG